MQNLIIIAIFKLMALWSTLVYDWQLIHFPNWMVLKKTVTFKLLGKTTLIHHYFLSLVKYPELFRIKSGAGPTSTPTPIPKWTPKDNPDRAPILTLILNLTPTKPQIQDWVQHFQGLSGFLNLWLAAWNLHWVELSIHSKTLSSGKNSTECYTNT